MSEEVREVEVEAAPVVSAETDEERERRDPWGADAHMESLRAMACKRIDEYTSVDHVEDDSAGPAQAFVAGLRLASHVLRHLCSVDDDHPAGHGIELIEDIANAAEDGREPGEEETA